MNPAIEPALRQAALTTFGDMCMALPSVEMSVEQIESPFEAEVRVRFHGSVRGEVSVRLYGTVLDSLAQGMRGDNELMPTDLLRDALGEIGNVICGNALPLVAGEHGKYRLDPPRAALANDPPLGGPAVQTKTQVGLDGGRAEVGIYLEEATSDIPHPPLRGPSDPGPLRPDRVGGALSSPTSHTTGHAGPHPAVQKDCNA